MVVQRLRRGTSRRRSLGVGLVGSGVDWGLPCSTSSVIRRYASLSEVCVLRFDPGLGTRLCDGLRARHGDLGFPLSDAGRLAGEMAEVVELGAANASATHDLNLSDHRAVKRKDPLDADAVRDLANGEGRGDSTAALGDADALEGLDSFLVALANSDVDAEGVTGPERGNVVAEPLFLGVDEGMHMTLGAGVNSRIKTCFGGSWVATKSKLRGRLMPVTALSLSRSLQDPRFLVSLSPSCSLHFAIRAWSPDNSTSGTWCPRNSGGRV